MSAKLLVVSVVTFCSELTVSVSLKHNGRKTPLFKEHFNPAQCIILVNSSSPYCRTHFHCIRPARSSWPEMLSLPLFVFTRSCLFILSIFICFSNSLHCISVSPSLPLLLWISKSHLHGNKIISFSVSALNTGILNIRIIQM